MLVLGQASDEDTRSRARASDLASAAYTADVVTRTYRDHVGIIRTTLASLALNPRPDISPLGLAVASGDPAALSRLAEQVRAEYPRYVVRSYVVLRRDPDTVTDGVIAAVSPADASLVGRRLSELSEPIRNSLDSIIGLGRMYVTGMIGPPYVAGADAPFRLLAAASIPGQAPFPRFCGAVCLAIYSPAQLVVELDNSRIFADAAGPSLGPGDDAYVLDPQHRLIARVQAPVSVPLLDLSGDPVLGRVGLDEPRTARAGITDPLGGSAGLIATAPLSLDGGTALIPASGALSMNVVVARDTSLSDRALESTLAQLAAFRTAIVILLLVLVVLSVVAERHLTRNALYQERLRLARDLHDLLGHSLSVIALKSQLARRLIASGDATGAMAEIMETESVARESLEDVRGAVDGYRQPTFGSALAGARAALASAGIDSTLENAAGPLPAAVDATFAWILREAVTNVIRHSRAATCSIRLTRRANEALLEVVDDGRSAPAAAGNGLRGLQERAAARGGHADVGPRPEGGFRVQVAIPV